MRLDKLLSESGVASRSEASRACRSGAVTVNGVPVRKADTHVNPETDVVVFFGTPVVYRRFVFIMLNKPEGYVSATEDGRAPVVTDLLSPEYRRMGLFPCGRLDKYTVGLMLLTNNGPLAHRLLAPRSHVAKSYAFSAAQPLSQSAVARLEAGVDIGGYVTKPCRIELKGDTQGIITITEGKYHQIKRMLEAENNRVVYLERLTFGSLSLDPALKRGEWRLLTPEEEQQLNKDAERSG